MDIGETEIKLASAVAPLVLGVGEKVVQHKMEKDAIEKQKEMEMEVIEARHEAKQESGEINIPSGGQAQPQQPRQPQQPEQDARSERDEIVERLDAVKSRTTCGDCQRVAESLKDEPLDVAKEGLRELEDYMDLKDELVEEDVSEKEARERMENLMGDFEVFPEMLLR